MSQAVDAAKAKVDKVAENVKQVASPAGEMSALNLYSRVAFAGAVCCSVTHGGLTPVDVYAKTSPGPARSVAWKNS